MWEGGVKATAFITGGWLGEERMGEDMDALMHVTDWMPTILSFAGVDTGNVFGDGDIDGLDQAENIMFGETDKYSPREYVYRHGIPDFSERDELI